MNGSLACSRAACSATQPISASSVAVAREARTGTAHEPSHGGDELVPDFEFGVGVVLGHVVLLHLVGTAMSMTGPLAICAHF